MFLKSIEVHGFKSFANKILFEFNDGITGIVGPNGSGKSNVADAVRWVLGEQSAKQLRGASMQDIIFAGTQNRKPQGYAYVAITFDNADHALAIDYDEVTVSRRVYRSGESEYQLNGTTCRLRDINELFYDTGIGKEGYSIIGQGQIDKILSGKPEDRRELFDEAAGIVKFKKRKNIAQKKLDDERQNLVRVTDILTELEKQVGPLEEQSKKAREYLKLRESLKTLDLQSFFMENRAAKERLAVLEENLGIAGAELDKKRAEAEKLKEQYDALTAQAAALDEKLGQSREALNQAQVSAKSMEGQIHVLEEQIHTESVREEQLTGRLAAVKEQLTRYEKELNEFTDQKGTLNEELDALDEKQETIREQIRADEDRVRELDLEISGRRNAMMNAMNDKASIGARNQRFETLLEQNQVRKSELSKQLLQIRSEEEVQNDVIGRLEAQIRENREMEEACRKKEEELLAQASENQELLRRENRSLNQTSQEYHTQRTRLESLRNLAERYDGYGNSIRRVMEVRSSVPGIIGVVADLLETEKTYETAIETALGGAIQNIVTDSETTAKQLIGYLKKNKYGRATFLPLTSITARGGFSRREALREPGAVGLANTLVKVKGGYDHLAEYLLGRILVVDNIDHAIAIAKKYQYSLRIVTLEGELLSAGGSMTGGAFKNSSNLLGRKRELDELEQSMTRSLARYDEIKERVHACEQEQKRIGGERDKNREAYQTARVNLSSLEASLQAAKRKAEEIRLGYTDIHEEGRELAKKRQEIEAGKAALKEEEQSLEIRNREQEQEITALEAKTGEARETLEKRREALSAVQLEFSAMSQKDSFLLENIRRINGELEALIREEEELTEALSGGRTAVTEKQQEIQSIREQIAGLTAQAGTYQKQIEADTEKKAACTKEQGSFFAKQEAMNAELGRLDKEQFRLENQKEKCEEAMEAQIQYLWEEYELTPSQVEAPDPAERAGCVSDQKGDAFLKAGDPGAWAGQCQCH